MLARLTLALVLTACAAPAWAQDPIAAAKAHADAVIARGNAGGAFINITTSDQPAVRHVASGLTCLFNTGDDRDTISIIPSYDGGPVAGDDVGCSSWWESTLVSVFATRYSQRYSADQIFASSINDIQANWENVVPIEREFSGVLLPGQEMPLFALFSAERQGRPRQTALVVRHVGDWSFKVRATGEPADTNMPRVASAVFAISIPGGWDAFLAEQ